MQIQASGLEKEEGMDTKAETLAETETDKDT